MKGQKLFEELGNIRGDFIQDTANSLYGEEERNEEAEEGKGEQFHSIEGIYAGKETGKWRKRQYAICGAAAAIAILLIGTVYLKGHFSTGRNGTVSVAEKQQDTDLEDKKEGVQEPLEKDDEVEIKKGGASAKEGTDIYQVQSVKYPTEPVDWRDNKEWQPDDGYLKSLKNFYQETFQNTLISETKENTACSPVNLYLCMAMLTEMTSGKTQSELLDALGQDNVKTVREQSQKIWNAAYEDGGISKCILGNSIWLNQDISYQQNVLETISDNYYASTYQGEMGTLQMDESIHKWVNDMTGNALKEHVKGIATQADTAAVLLSTAYFYDQWVTPFSEEDTKKGVFNNADGSKSECDFMKQVATGKYICRKKDFTSVSLSFENQKSMWIFLPNEGVTADDLLGRDMADILHIVSDHSYNDKDGEMAEVTIKLPKFQIDTGEIDLIPAMQKMGVESLFSMGDADFTRLVGEKNEEYNIYANNVVQASKVAVDENGCSVASYTEVDLPCGSVAPDKKYTLNCNRPFLFVIADSWYGIPVFAGVVNEIE